MQGRATQAMSMVIVEGRQSGRRQGRPDTTGSWVAQRSLRRSSARFAPLRACSSRLAFTAQAAMRALNSLSGCLPVSMLLLRVLAETFPRQGFVPGQILGCSQELELAHRKAGSVQMFDDTLFNEGHKIRL
jgi:hypothetical protein